MRKKGELATEQIVLLVILIASFAILLFFFMRLDIGKQTDAEICHNSVVTRGNSALPSDSVPLKCQRQYVCLTEDGSCDQMTNPVIHKVSSKEEVYDYLAEDLSNCWWMFGEGRINYVSDEAFSSLYCSICSQIAFDDSMVTIFRNGEIDKNEIYSYMTTHNYSNSKTYLEYLYGTGSSYSKIQEQLQNQGVSFAPIDMTKQYYSMMGISSDVSTLGWAVKIGATAAFFALLPITGTTTFISVLSYGVAGVGTGYGVGFIVKGISGNDYLSPSIIEVNSPEFKSLKCESITTLA